MILSISPDPARHYFYCSLLGFTLAFLYLLKDEKCRLYRQYNPAFALLVLTSLIGCGCYLLFSREDKNYCRLLLGGGLMTLVFLFGANVLLHTFRQLTFGYGLAPCYRNGIANAEDLRLLKYDLHNGFEMQVISLLMRDARAHNRMQSYRQLLLLRRNLQGKEMLARHYPMQSSILPYQKFLIRKQVQDMLDKDIRNSL